MRKFRFKNYDFDFSSLTASFRYVGADGTEFCETVKFAKPEDELPLGDRDYARLLDSALKLAFYLIGTSYYKSHPTREVEGAGLTTEQADFFSVVYQDGLSQFAYENHLARADLATFTGQEFGDGEFPRLNGFSDSALILQSGGKDSLLNAKLNAETPHIFWYLGSSENHPAILDNLGARLQVAVRRLDREGLSASGGMNGHVPVTYIVMALALIQAILNRQKTVLTSIGQEGSEAHAVIRGERGAKDLAVNHQWSKTLAAEKLFRDYVHKFISPELDVYSPLRQYTELKIAKLFAEKCWGDYGRKFSSCNVANYGQGADNRELRWCGNCAKCANSYLLFAPFVPRAELDGLFGGRSLFENEKLLGDFRGLLGADNQMKPFECVGEIGELRYAYHRRLPEYPSLPFRVPEADFDIDREA